jgi:hypothetical protein
MTSQPATERISSPRARSYDWYQVWFSALFHPTPQAYARWLNDPHVSLRRCGVWFSVSAIISGLLGAFLFSPQGSLTLMLGVGIPIEIVFTLAIMGCLAGVIYGMSRWLGGTGSYTKTAYALAAFDVPLTIITMMALWLPLRWLSLSVLMAYWMGLMVVATKSVHGLSWKRSLAACLPIILAMVVGIGLAFPFIIAM